MHFFLFFRISCLWYLHLLFFFCVFRLSPISGELADETKTLVVNVKPGWKAGTKITFPSEGDEGPGGLPADLVFVVQEKPHAKLKREGNNLIITNKVVMKLRSAMRTTRLPNGPLFF